MDGDGMWNPGGGARVKEGLLRMVRAKACAKPRQGLIADENPKMACLRGDFGRGRGARVLPDEVRASRELEVPVEVPGKAPAANEERTE
jgi:hypothetical protein